MNCSVGISGRAEPPVITAAPFAFASATCSTILRALAAVCTGPIVVDGSRGSPSRTSEARAARRSGGDGVPGRRAAREADGIGARVRNQGVPDHRTLPYDEVDRPIWEVGRLDAAHELAGHGRSAWRGDPHHGV